MGLILIYGIVLLIYWVCPKYLKAVIFIINLLLPDPIPFVDEVVMAAGLLS